MADQTAHQAMLSNRVTKNARHLAKWARREGVTCYRIYDRDIPEIPITVDTYEGALVVNDYRFEAGDDGWIDAMASAAQGALGAGELFVKRRERHDRRDGEQYERQGSDPRAWRSVHEGGHEFRVNLADYVDTGLFLDHRITRSRVAAERATTMLNLFAYTGSFSVYAAAAGMRTTSVDMSRTYVEWTADNLARNSLTGELVQADVREFLREARAGGRRWDVAVVDPPTFSSSKRMDYTFDVQRDHVALLDDVAAVASVIWFSTNRKKFRFDWQRGDIEELTRDTTPPDFRHRPHRSYRIVVEPV